MDTPHVEEGYQVELPEFEGPLDLLLHLVKRHELNIIDIPISFITEKYLEHLDLMRQLNLDIAGEYLLMAATLAYIKSRELMPRDPLLDGAEEGEEEEGDPRQELIRRLLEYQKYKEAAQNLEERPLLGKHVFRRGAPMDPVDESEIPFVEVEAFALISALADALKRSEMKLTHDVVIDRISITDRINQIVDLLSEKETIRFLDCFALEKEKGIQRHDVVVTFLAILEMTRLKILRILQQTHDGEIYITRRGEAPNLASEEVQDTYAGS